MRLFQQSLKSGLLATSIMIILALFLWLILLFWYSPFFAFRISFGSLYTLFFPGLVWSYPIFKENNLELFERIVLSIALSTALIPVAFFIANTFGMKINLINSFWLILGIDFLAILSWPLRPITIFKK